MFLLMCACVYVQWLLMAMFSVKGEEQEINCSFTWPKILKHTCLDNKIRLVKLPKSSNLLLKSADSFGIIGWIIKDPRSQITRIEIGFLGNKVLTYSFCSVIYTLSLYQHLWHYIAKKCNFGTF